ncbi:Dicarboxylate transporter 2.1, chloroplastic [Symbiodinium microadriaticum]|uniref:Dicarboxylate transporter 2.1, chloroplastic n=1 Tax=Symbiodinium microadriaticum TaxID=2951 RepID=A0A1Q9CVI3_SYMMI|nr:Dicarboxylate transporter 2.1, chloroplastic [Symbiodinium microadriaticum]
MKVPIVSIVVPFGGYLLGTTMVNPSHPAVSVPESRMPFYRQLADGACCLGIGFGVCRLPIFLAESENREEEQAQAFRSLVHLAVVEGEPLQLHAPPVRLDLESTFIFLASPKTPTEVKEPLLQQRKYFDAKTWLHQQVHFLERLLPLMENLEEANSEHQPLLPEALWCTILDPQDFLIQEVFGARGPHRDMVLEQEFVDISAEADGGEQLPGSLFELRPYRATRSTEQLLKLSSLVSDVLSHAHSISALADGAVPPHLWEELKEKVVGQICQFLAHSSAFQNLEDIMALDEGEELELRSPETIMAHSQRRAARICSQLRKVKFLAVPLESGVAGPHTLVAPWRISLVLKVALLRMLGVRDALELPQESQGGTETENGAESFSDVTLRCDGGSLFLHRNILMARSDYFRAMFQVSLFEIPLEVAKILFGNLAAPMQYLLATCIMAKWMSGPLKVLKIEAMFKRRSFEFQQLLPPPKYVLEQIPLPLSVHALEGETGAQECGSFDVALATVEWGDGPSKAHMQQLLLLLAVLVCLSVLGRTGLVLSTHGQLRAGCKIRLAIATAGFEVVLLCFLHYLEHRRGPKWQGADVRTLAPCLLIGWLIRFAVPIPIGVTEQAWSMLAIFVAMIVGVVTGPMPPAAVAIAAVSTAVVTGTVTLAQGLKAFTDEVVWLVVIAFFFAEGFHKTGLGDRIALNVIQAVGGTTLGVAYGLNFVELLVAAAMPCSAARAAAVFYPITQSVCKASGSDPHQGTASKCGKFLVECCYQATTTSSCMFLTGAAQNYFVLKLAEEVGVVIERPFQSWLRAAFAPAVVSFLMTPLIALRLMPPESRTTPDAPKAARQQLAAMGPVSDDEKIFGALMMCMVCLWATTSILQIPPVVTALCGFAGLLLTGVLTWEDCASNKAAWSTFISFATLVGLAEMLKALGIVEWSSSVVTSHITAAGLTQVHAFLIIVGAYWAVHYLFASQVAHVSALFQPFLVMLAGDSASAQSAVIFAGQYIQANEWYKAGLVYMVAYYLQWLTVGAVWWRIIGLL